MQHKSRPSGWARLRVGVAAWWIRVWVALNAMAAWTSAQAQVAGQWVRSLTPRGAPTRAILLEELQRAELGEPRVGEDEAAMAGTADAFADTVRVRATRAPRTDAAARRAIRTLREFVQANDRLLARSRGQPSHTTYDIVLEAFVFAEEAGVAEEACPWQRARRPHDVSAAPTAGAARAALERLDWSRGGDWRRSRAMEKAWGVGDPEDVNHYQPIFCWELVEGLRLQGAPATPWEMAGAAMAVMSVLGARRGGGASALKVEEVSIAGPNAVEVAPRSRPKEHRERATRRPRKQVRPVVLRHWLVERHVIPWIKWHQRRRSPGSALLFPAITAKKTRATTALGYAADGQWVEPLREWSARQRRAIIEKYIPGLGDRAFHGFRAGNQCELRRWADVSAVTRRALHGRSIRHLIGSEAAYDQVFAEDYAVAVERLGQMRIERSRNGLLTVVATSPSAGEDPRDWTPLPGGPVTLAAPAQADSSSSESSSGEEDSVVGDGARETRVINCGRCRRKLAARDYGFLCDVPGCTWGACTTCHPGGARAALRCPAHRGSR